MARLGVGRDHDRGHPEAEAELVEAGGRQVVVEAAVLVVAEDERAPCPLRSRGQAVDGQCGEALPPADVVRPVLGERVLGDHPADRRQPTGGRIGEEFRVRPARAGVGATGREVAERVVGAAVRRVRDVAAPVDPGLVQPVGDRRAGQRRAGEGAVVADAAGGGGNAENAIERGAAEGRAEVVVAEREAIGQGPVVGQVLARVIGERGTAADPREPLCGIAGGLGAGRLQVVRRRAQTQTRGVRHRRAGREAVGTGKEAEVMVEGPVLLHQEDDVLERRLSRATDPDRRERRQRRPRGGRPEELTSAQHGRLSSPR